MRLRTRLVLVIAAASVLPTLAATGVGRELIERRSRQQFERLLRDGKTEVLARFRELREETVRVVERLADPDDHFVGPILVALAGGALDGEDHRRRALAAGRVMRERGLQVLTVFDADGDILASGHFPGRLGDRDGALARAAARRCTEGAVLAWERALEDDKPTTWLTLQVWRRVSSPLGASAVVVGGRRLGPTFTRGLHLRGATVARLQDARGRHLAGPTSREPYDRYPTRTVPLTDPSGKTVATVSLAVPDDELRRTLSLVNRAAAAVGLCGLLLALLLGALAARRITRPVQDVVDGASRVAAGDLDVRLDVRSPDEMGALVEAFNRRVAELRDAREKLLAAERVAAWRDIARRIAHEIKNPLFPIQTSIETLQKVYRKKHPDFDEIFDESTTTILEEVGRLKAIVTEFSRFARMPKPNLAPCDLGELASSVVSLHAGDGVPIQAEVPPDLPPALADRDQMTQVLVNLVKNALEAVADRSEPEVRVTLARTEDRLLLAVADNGPGFDQETRRRIFDPYFTTKGTTCGTGLGLAIVHRIVTDHNGDIEARSEPGEGATFTLRLPLADL